VNIAVTDRAALDPVRVGLEISVALRRLYPTNWEAEKIGTLLLHRATLDAILAGEGAERVLETAREGLADFDRRRGAFLLSH
jgi:hypothetical protein